MKAALAGLLAFVSQAWAATPPVPAPVAPATTAVKGNVGPGMVRGITRCANDLNMSFPVTGRIAAVPVVEGSVVKPRQLLMHLDQSAEALDVERRRLQWQSVAEVNAARSRMETAGEQAKAARQIYSSSHGISHEEMQNRELAFSLSKSEYERLKNAKEMERLDYLTAKENLARRSLLAPTRGIVVKIYKQIGEGVQANEPAIRVCDMSKILFVANVPSGEIGDLATKDEVSLDVGREERPVKGKVLFVSPVVDAASGLREVKIELLAPGDAIHPGMPARLNLAGGKKPRP